MVQLSFKVSGRDFVLADSSVLSNFSNASLRPAGPCQIV